MTPVRMVVRLVGRTVVTALAGAFITVVGLQYVRIIEKNVALADQLAAAQTDVRALEAKRAEADRQIRRLSDPAGAIPEIHAELHLVRDGETLIYLKRHDDGP